MATEQESSLVQKFKNTKMISFVQLYGYFCPILKKTTMYFIHCFPRPNDTVNLDLDTKGYTPHKKVGKLIIKHVMFDSKRPSFSPRPLCFLCNTFVIYIPFLFVWRGRRKRTMLLFHVKCDLWLHHLQHIHMILSFLDKTTANLMWKRW